LAGTDFARSSLEFPAATTTVTPAAVSRHTAAWKASLSVVPHLPSSVPSPPRLMLTT
jgi:hypothetical protein